MAAPDSPVLAVEDASPAQGSTSEQESAAWVRALTATGPEHDVAVERLHAMLLRVCHAECSRRQRQLGTGGPELDDLAHQAAADATMAVTAKISTFRGDSRFTTWAYKFAVYEVSSKIGRHFWQARTTSLEIEDWDRLPDRLGSDPAAQAQHRQLLGAVRAAVDTALSDRQRRLFVAIVVQGVSLDTLVAETGSTRGAIYKSVFDARRKIRQHLVTHGYLDESSHDGAAKEGS